MLDTLVNLQVISTHDKAFVSHEHRIDLSLVSLRISGRRRDRAPQLTAKLTPNQPKLFLTQSLLELVRFARVQSSERLTSEICVESWR